jgi:hypothetical protein
MPSQDDLPTAYVEFFARAFAKTGNVVRDPDYIFAAAETVEAVDECATCGIPIINLTAFVEGIGEHYLLTDEQMENLELELEEAGIEVSDEDQCSQHMQE